jgi:hypothetical protein
VVLTALLSAWVASRGAGTLTLVFRNAGTVTIQAPVTPPGTPRAGAAALSQSLAPAPASQGSASRRVLRQ